MVFRMFKKKPSLAGAKEKKSNIQFKNKVLRKEIKLTFLEEKLLNDILYKFSMPSKEEKEIAEKNLKKRGFKRIAKGQIFQEIENIRRQTPREVLLQKFEDKIAGELKELNGKKPTYEEIYEEIKRRFFEPKKDRHL